MSADTEFLIDSNSEVDDNSNQNFGFGVTNKKKGQAFAGDDAVVSRVRFRLRAYESSGVNPVGPIQAEVYAITGTYGTNATPTGSPIATSESIESSDVVRVDNDATDWYDFYFKNGDAALLSSGTNYAVVVSGSSMTADYIALSSDGNSHGGNSSSFNGTSWSAVSADYPFEIYGHATPEVETQTPSAIGSSKLTLLGEIHSVGASSPTERGFVYSSTGSKADPGNKAPAGTGYESSYTETGSYSAEAFNTTVTGLNSNTQYYIRAYAKNTTGYEYGEEIQVATSRLTSVTFNSTDPTDIVKTVLDNMNELGGVVAYSGSSTDDTGLSISYTFNVATVLDAVKVAHEYSPATWYWYVDLATNILYFRQTATIADHTLVKGRHLSSVNLVMSTENVKNLVYFTGGLVGSTNLFRKYEDSASVSSFGQRIDRRTDNRVTLNDTADLYGGSTIARLKDEQYHTVVEVIDGTYDLTLFKPGDTVKFANFGTFLDSLLLQIVRIEYEPESIKLTLGTLPIRLTSTIEDFKRQILSLETVDNPTEPS